MSTILKALRRLEEEKSASGSRPLREEIAKPPFSAGPPPRRGLPVVGLAIGFALLLGFATWWLLPPEAADEPTIAGTAAEAGNLARVESEPASAERSAARRSVARSSVAADGPPAEAFSSPVEVVPRPTVTPRVPIELSPREAPAEVAAAPVPEPVAPSTKAKAPPKPPVVAVAPTPKPRPVSRPAPRPSATPEVAAPSAPAERVPAVAERPARVAVAPKPDPPPTPEAVKPAPVAPAPLPVEPTPPVVAAPRIRVDKTLWHPQRDRREAVVGLEGAAVRRVHEGDVVGRFVVSEIQPSGVVFESDGTTLRRGIGAD